VAHAGRLVGRACVIVGGTGGIGLASARRFLEEGARVVVAGRSPESGWRVLDELRRLGSISEFEIELSEGEASVTRLFEYAVEVLGGRFDVLLHVAGFSGREFGDDALHECTSEAWVRVMQVNAQGTFHTNREAVRTMREQELDPWGLRGTVLNIGSVLDRSPAPAKFGTVAYAASKGAVRAMTLAAAARYAPDRARFNLLVPGLVDTPMAARATNDLRLRSYLATKQPLGGGPGGAVDVAEGALYPCEPASRFVTGAELTVDDGWCVSEGQRQDGE
jgi:NAD(P)-dependent dehydrogenase (short-subunit alcohol dehydrogenase family)